MRVILGILLLLLSQPSAGDPPLRPVTYTQEQIDELLEAIGRRPVDLYRLSRSSDGRELRLEMRSEFILFRTDGRIRSVVKPQRATWLDDSGSVVASLDGSVLVSAGTRVELRPEQAVDVDPSGTYLLVTSPSPYRTEVRSLRAPLETRLSLAGAWEGFGQDGRLVLVTRGEKARSLHVVVLVDREGKLETERSLEIPRSRGAHSPYYALDVDLASDSLLEIETVDVPFGFMTRLHLVKLASGEKRRIARDGWALFLERDPLKPPRGGGDER